jgi:hypothetical protein
MHNIYSVLQKKMARSSHQNFNKTNKSILLSNYNAEIISKESSFS